MKVMRKIIEIDEELCDWLRELRSSVRRRRHPDY